MKLKPRHNGLSLIDIGKVLILSPPFPCLQTVQASFKAYGFPSRLYSRLETISRFAITANVNDSISSFLHRLRRLIFFVHQLIVRYISFVITALSVHSGLRCQLWILMLDCTCNAIWLFIYGKLTKPHIRRLRTFAGSSVHLRGMVRSVHILTLSTL